MLNWIFQLATQSMSAAVIVLVVGPDTVGIVHTGYSDSLKTKNSVLICVQTLRSFFRTSAYVLQTCNLWLPDDLSQLPEYEIDQA